MNTSIWELFPIIIVVGFCFGLVFCEAFNIKTIRKKAEVSAMFAAGIVGVVIACFGVVMVVNSF